MCANVCSNLFLLRTVISSKLALDTLIDKAMRAVFKLRQHNLRDNVLTSIKLFKALVSPIIRYGCEVWAPFETNGISPENLLGLCEKTPIEKINNKFCKYLLGSHKYTSNLAVKGEVGMPGLLTDCMYHSIKYWLRFVNNNMDHESLVYKSYQENFSTFSSSNAENWCLRIRNILSTLELDNVWQNQGVDANFSSETNLLSILKEKINCQYATNWEHTISMSTGKLRTYKLFKKSFKLENYLLCCKFNDRKFFSRLRTSSHQLKIETGRHKRPLIPSEARFCPTCEDAVEDELHFLLHCKLYSSLRNSLFDSLNFVNFNSYSEKDKFIYLMSYNDGDPEIANTIVTFIKSAFNLRFPT